MRWEWERIRPKTGTPVAAVSVKCKGCYWEWWIPKEAGLAMTAISNCPKNHCPYSGKDVSWLTEIGKTPSTDEKIVIVEEYKKKKHHHNTEQPALTDCEVSEKFPKMVYQRMKFKR